jgi:hypothetical protein
VAETPVTGTTAVPVTETVPTAPVAETPVSGTDMLMLAVVIPLELNGADDSG